MPGILFPVLVQTNLYVCSFSWHSEDGGLGSGVREQKTNKQLLGEWGRSDFYDTLGSDVNNTNFKLVHAQKKNFFYFFMRENKS